MTIPAIDQNAGEGSENERGDLSEESDDAEEEYGAGEPIYEPAGRVRVIQVPTSETVWPLKKSR